MRESRARIVGLGHPRAGRRSDADSRGRGTAAAARRSAGVPELRRPRHRRCGGRGQGGEPVTNRTAADFEVRDEGRPQAISVVPGCLRGGAAAAVGPVAARRYAFSTNTGANAVPGRAFVLFFDDVHLTQAEGDRAKVALAQFLERELRAGDLVSLVAPGTALRWHARMPDGRPELTRIVAGLRGLFLPDPSSDQDERLRGVSDQRLQRRAGGGPGGLPLAERQGQRPRARQPGDQPGVPAAEPLAARLASSRRTS